MTASTIPDKHEAQRQVGQFMDFASICSCGCPEEFLRLLLTHMRTRFDEDGRAAPDRADRPLKEPINLTLAVVMDCWGLAEHGSSIYGAWLTRAGLRLRAALQMLDLGDDERNGTDLDELLPSNRDGWWAREHERNPKWTSDGVRYAELGEWQEDS